VLFVFGVLLLNDNLGLSWSALRRLLPVAIILVYAMSGRTRKGAAAVAALAGIQVVTSLEYAVAALFAIGTMGIADAIARRSVAPLVRVATIGLAGLGVGALLAFLMMGGDTPGWLLATWETIRVRGAGEAAFAFQPSVNAGAAFLLLLLAAGRFGAGLRALQGGELAPGDLGLIGSLAYALVAFKSGLARSDMYHLAPPLLGIIAMVMLPWRWNTFSRAPGGRRLATAAVLTLAVTYALGFSGAGRFWLRGWALGAWDVVRGVPLARADVPARHPRISTGINGADPLAVSLTRYLESGPHAQAPVFYYERAWGLDKFVGVAKPVGIYATDDYLVSDELGLRLRDYLAQHPDAIVIVDQPTWDYLLDPAKAPGFTVMFWFRRTRSLPVRFLEVVTSSHFGDVVIDEQVHRRDRWVRTVGSYVRDAYTPDSTFGRMVILKRTANAARDPGRTP
jgi:hypothetical protein